MSDLNHKAREAAEAYAPKPVGSSIMYGLIAVVSVGLALISFEMFYNANIFAYPLIIVLLLSVTFLLGIMLRKRRKRVHAAALQAEMDKN